MVIQLCRGPTLDECVGPFLFRGGYPFEGGGVAPPESKGGLHCEGGMPCG